MEVDIEKLQSFTTECVCKIYARRVIW